VLRKDLGFFRRRKEELVGLLGDREFINGVAKMPREGGGRVGWNIILDEQAPGDG